MSIVVEGGVVRLLGQCGADDVEALIAALQDGGQIAADFSATDHLHGAVLQTLLIFTPEVLGSPRDSFVRTWLIPVLQAARRKSELAGDQPPSHHSVDRRRIE
jgi:hypothetical protein